MRMNVEQVMIVKVFKEESAAYLKVLRRHSCGETEENRY
jgi:hypothetical protein